MQWIKFIVTKDQSFILDTHYLPLTRAANAHLYMRDGYTWVFFKKEMDDEVVYYLKSDHLEFIEMIKNKIPSYEFLIEEPDISNCTVYFGGSDGVPFRGNT